MTSSHHRRLLWRKKEQEKNVENDEIPLMMQEEDSTTSSGLESKFAEFDRILKSDQWSMAGGTSRDNDEYTNVDSDVEDRDESHLSDLQRELEAAELGAAVAPSHREHHEEEQRDHLVPENPAKLHDSESLASCSTADSFDVEVAIEKIKLQKKAMEQASQDGSDADEQNVRFARFVAQMEHDFDGAILAMMENHAETNYEENDSQVVDEERDPEHEQDLDNQNFEPTELPPIYPIMEAVEEEVVLESRLKIFDDSSSDEDTDFTPFSVPDDAPSDESRANICSPLPNIDKHQVPNYCTPPDSTSVVSSPSDYSYNPYEQKQESSLFEPPVDLDQFVLDSVETKQNPQLETALEQQHAVEVSQHVAQHHVTYQMGVDDGYGYGDDYLCDEDQYWGFVQKSRYPIASASFICLILLLIQIFAFRELLGLLLDYHQSTVNLLDPAGGLSPLCEADFGCQSAISVSLGDSGERRIFASTTEVENAIEIQNNACRGSIIQSPALWYSLIGDGSRHTATVFPSPNDFEASIMVLEGDCTHPDIYYGPVQCCGQDGESSLIWDTIEGKEYFVAVFGAQPNSTGSFRMTIWNAQHTKQALAGHIKHRGVNSFKDLAVGGSAGISMTFLAAVALT